MTVATPLELESGAGARPKQQLRSGTATALARSAARRVLLFVPTLLVVLVGVSLLSNLVPGDPAVAALGPEASPEARAAYLHQNGLDRPVLEQISHYLSGLAHGDLGLSATSREPVASAISARAGVTVSLVLCAILIAVLVGVTAGVIAGLRPGGWLDRVVTVVAGAGIALPEFWFAIILSYLLGLKLGLFPTTGYVSIGEDPAAFASHIFLPALALAIPPASELARQTRASVIEVAGQDYIRICMANGLPTRSIVGKHVLKNAAIPVVTVIAIQLARLVGSAALVEIVFNIQGIGYLAVTSALSSDITTVQGVVVCVALVVLFANMLADLSYVLLDPRVRNR